MDLSYCIVNSGKRDLLLACLESIYRTHPEGVDFEVIVLDNASEDGSPEAVRELFPDVRLTVRDQRAGAAENNTAVLREAQGEFCMLIDEDAELIGSATAMLLEALRTDPQAAIAGAQLLFPDGRRVGCAWRLPGVGTSLIEALFLGRWLTAQISHTTREAGYVQSATMLIRRTAAEQVGYFDSDFFVYFDETDFEKRVHDAGWRILHVPAARAYHHQQIHTDRAGEVRRVVEFHRMWDLYMRKHHSRLEALAIRPLVAWKYAVRALAAVVIPGWDPRRLLLHARQAMSPRRGEGMRERTEAWNAGR